jgi:hypothetical protein
MTWRQPRIVVVAAPEKGKAFWINSKKERPEMKPAAASAGA